MNFNVAKALSLRSLISNKDCFSLTVKFMLEDTKFIKNELLSIFLMANEASLGMFGLSLLICKAKSFIGSIMASCSLLFLLGLVSGTSRMVAFISGFSVIPSAT